MKKQLLAFFAFLLVANLFSLVLTPSLALATDISDEISNQLEPVGTVYGEQGAPDENAFAETIAEIIEIVLGFLGIIFLVLILYAGFLWMTAAGSEEKVKKAKDIMLAAVIGVTIVLAAYAITFFVIDKLLEATGVSTGGLQ